MRRKGCSGDLHSSVHHDRYRYFIDLRQRSPCPLLCVNIIVCDNNIPVSCCVSVSVCGGKGIKENKNYEIKLKHTSVLYYVIFGCCLLFVYLFFCCVVLVE